MDKSIEIIKDKLNAYHQNDVNGISELDYDELAKDIDIALKQRRKAKKKKGQIVSP